MSMHKLALTEIEREGLKKHGLDIGKPSQLSDVFRQGVAHGAAAAREACARVAEDWDTDSADPRDVATAIREIGIK